jgi:glutamyl-tRNA synthetase
MPQPYIGRLAPSPTGLLHLGHARTFWTAFERAQQADGILWLRNEDLDTQRARPEFVTAMHEDLHWLGITWQHELTQSTRLEAYRAAMQQLLASGLAYPCTCSRRDLAQSIAAPHDEETTNPPDLTDEPLYNNRCRPPTATEMGAPHRGPRRAHLLAGVAHLDSEMWEKRHELQPNTNYRLRVPDGETIHFTDLHAGPQSFTAGRDFGDFLIWRKALSPSGDDNLPSYQLACVVDDAHQRITEVVRGRDLLKSTARQLLLQRALQLPTPAYFHTDLMRDPNGLRLAKRHDALSLRALRASGLTPAQVRAMF